MRDWLLVITNHPAIVVVLQLVFGINPQNMATDISYPKFMAQ